MDDKKIILINENGEEHEFNVMFTFHHDERNADFVLIYEDENPDKIFIYQYFDDNRLAVVDDDAVFEEAQELLDLFMEQNFKDEEGTDN